MVIFDILTWALLGLGALVAVTGGVGVLRMPDFYTRAHCSGKGDTLAQALILVGLTIHFVAHHGVDLHSFPVPLRLLLITAFITITAPTATHAVARAAQQDGLEPWKKGDPRR